MDVQKWYLQQIGIFRGAGQAIQTTLKRKSDLNDALNKRKKQNLY